jgi:hypothetical protein
LLADQPGESQNRTLDTFCSQPNSGQRSDGLGAHTLLIVKPEDEAVSLLIRAGGTAPKAFIDLFQ